MAPAAATSDVGRGRASPGRAVTGGTVVVVVVVVGNGVFVGAAVGTGIGMTLILYGPSTCAIDSSRLTCEKCLENTTFAIFGNGEKKFDRPYHITSVH